MSFITLGAIRRAATIWLSLAAILLGSVLVGGVRGPWNYYWLFTMVCWAVLDLYWALAARGAKATVAVRQNRVALLVMMLIYALYCLPLSSIPLLGQRVLPRSAALQMLGALMCAFGVGFAIWSRRVLSDSWNATVARGEGQFLVKRDPYAIVRHPIYFGFLVAVVGMVFVLGEFRAIALLFGVEFLLKKMGQEEYVMQTAFPKEYPEYEQSVKKLLPWVW